MLPVALTAISDCCSQSLRRSLTAVGAQLPWLRLPDNHVLPVLQHLLQFRISLHQMLEYNDLSAFRGHVFA